MAVHGEEIHDCTACRRPTLNQGPALTVEAAVDCTGETPVLAHIHDLASSKNRKKQKRHSDLVERFEQMAIYGTLEVPREMNELGGGLMEIKTSLDRIPFYYKSADNAHRRAARLTHGFETDKGKTADGKTPRKQLDKGHWVKRCDQQIERRPDHP